MRILWIALLMFCVQSGCTVVRIRNIPGDRWTKEQTQELTGWWCSTGDKVLWRSELTGNDELLIGSITRRAHDKFELTDSVAIPTRVGNRDLLCVRIKTSIEAEAGYGFLLIRRADKDHMTLLFPNGDFFKQLIVENKIDGKLISYEKSDESFVYISENERDFLAIINDLPDDQVFDTKFKIELSRLKLP